MKDVATVLEKKDSPFKRKVSQMSDGESSRKRYKLDDKGESLDDEDDDSYQGMGDEDYYDDQFDMFDDVNSTNNDKV